MYVPERVRTCERTKARAIERGMRREKERETETESARREILGRGASSPVVEGGAVRDLADGHP